MPQAETMNRNLFVYGSLLASAGHPMGDRLRREARLLGEATIEGRLYRISWYPGLVLGGGPDARVHGEVYALNTPAPTLKWLDAYEGLGRGPADQHDYERVERPVTLASASTASPSQACTRSPTAAGSRHQPARADGRRFGPLEVDAAAD
jgi:gamma-glutamylcyclotransferase (GGCT)/AIG2-like uncharacterized protein YtfP